MFKHGRRLTGLSLPTALAAIAFAPIAAFAQESMVKSSAVVPLSLNLRADSTVVSACPGESNLSTTRVQLSTSATSPSGKLLRYRWSTSAGRIDGDGPTVSWDLAGLQPGYYKAMVNAYTGNGEEECEAFSSTTVRVSRCTPVCPNLSIVGDDNIAVGKPLTFSATVAGGTVSSTPVYNWTVSAGKIIEGQGTSSIKVDATGLAGQTVQATLSLGGYNIDCSASYAVPIPVPDLLSRKFDEFPNLARNDEKARLDNYAVELQNDQSATGYVIIYPGRGGRSTDAQKRAIRIVDYLVNSRRMDSQRIVVLFGPRRDELLVELWNTPQGARPPTVQ